MRVALVVALLAFSALALAHDATVSNSAARDPAQVRAFRKDHPCPATGKATGACRGYVVDHIVPLCAGGADAPSNMIWQAKAESHEKDKAEWALCRWIRRLERRKRDGGQ